MTRHIDKTLAVAFFHFSYHHQLSIILNTDFYLFRKDAEDSAVLGVALT
jgi:hypothetical protein